MIYFLIPATIAVLIIAMGTAVLIRRDRRRMAGDSATMRVEAAATRGIRDTRRRARAHQLRFLRERE
ncbi:hypothetical protein [Streptomyces odontomachi]|uniref:hypothetical protein n=1 Tax=Streptomyces odontomachi TaxID=2944940 RepID=UPI00210A3428|nr:hypothetical protein [Streptomyces sp. ODS25]